MKKIILPILGIIILIIGFFAGMEYKTYQIKNAFQQVFNVTTPSVSSPTPIPSTAMEQAKSNNAIFIDKAIGDEILLATLKLKTTSIKEEQIISSKYGSPKIAKDGAKFVLVNLEVTNTTNSSFSLSPDMLLVDNQKREFSPNDDIGLDNSMNYKELSPSIKETGSLLYEIPTDATGYSLVINKGGTNEVYKIILK